MCSCRIEVFFTEHVVQLHTVDLRTRRRAIRRRAGDEEPVSYRPPRCSSFRVRPAS